MEGFSHEWLKSQIKTLARTSPCQLIYMLGGKENLFNKEKLN